MAKLFTKSRFKTALSCPTKLYYESHPDVYANSKDDDPFLKALAQGGFQVGEYAKLLYPAGHDIKELDYESSVKQTNELLKKKNVVIFEAAIKYKGFFIRVDILEKKGNKINLIEVKSKSCNPKTFEDELWDKRALKKGHHSMTGAWKDYVYDVAFQAWVAQQANPDWEITPYLMCADKTQKASVNGLNQFFRIKENGNRSECYLSRELSLEELGNPLVTKLDCSEPVFIIHSNKELSERFKFEGKELGFEKGIKYIEKSFRTKDRIEQVISSACKGCEFNCNEKGLKNGFQECFQKAYGLTKTEIKGPFVFNVGGLRSQKFIDKEKVLITDLDQADIDPKPRTDGNGFSPSERQWLQIEKTLKDDPSPEFDLHSLEMEMNTWKFPLHFIDFETCMTALPFNEGRRPYEQIAFQFSHHTVDQKRNIVHKSEWINNKPGHFPNFDFVRALKKALGKKGTIFRFSHHENTVLLQIRDQLHESNEDDTEDLVSFIYDITSRKGSHEGKRNMVDLCEMVKRYYYSPLTSGSNSIKAVLPAVLAESKYLQEKYGKPIYGADIPSKNFVEHTWLTSCDGEIQSPYKNLPPLFKDYDIDELDLLMCSDILADGGAAMVAYAKLQFTDMDEVEREAITKGLLKYCELDTMAMVMIYEYFRSVVENQNQEEAAS